MYSLTVDIVIPHVGVTIHPDDSLEFDSTENLSVTFTVPINIDVLDDIKPAFFKGLITNPFAFEATENEFIIEARQHIWDNGLELCPDGVGGTYFIKDDMGKLYGVFKPTDEEPGALNNPKQLLDDPLLPPGGGSIREVAAYLLDHGDRAGVPPTYLVSDVNCRDSEGRELIKSGSIQQFIENIGDTTHIGATRFSVRDVHSIGIHDIRLMNTDRNDENIIVRQEGDQLRLVPIDHAYVLPPTLESVYFTWMYWRQAKEPFSPDTLRYIEEINVKEDETILRQLGLDDGAIRTMKLATIFLKKAAKHGMNLFTIASLVSRKKMSQPSELENLVQIVEKKNLSSNDFYEEFEILVEEFISNQVNKTAQQQA